MESRLLPSIFTVTTTDDSGPGSLRQAILDANGASGTSTIAFSIAGAGVHTIRPAMPLPAVTGVVIIDGTTEPGYAGVPLIELNGSAAGANAVGLTIKGGNSTVKGLIVNGFAQAGIELTIGWTDTITGNYLGTDATGTAAMGNGDGLLLSFSSNNVIGGTTAALRNLIAGNHGNGIHITSDVLTRGNLIEGNYVGTDITGTRSLGNRTGVELDEANNTVGGTAAGAGNVISGNDIGVAINSNGNVVQGDFIGTDVTGTAALGNRIGVAIESYPAQQVLIGGTPAAARNLISGNSYAGVEITGQNVALNTVQGNYIGTDVTGTRALGNGYGVYIAFDAGSNLIGGTPAGAGNLISGNATGVTVLSSTSNRIQGNLIGTNAAGTAALGNLNGVELLSGGSNMVGGAGTGAGNVISGNFNIGVLVATGGNQVQGNLIGVNAAGSAALPNTEGVYVSGPNNLIGGTAAGSGNVISGNASAGLDLFGTLATGNLVQGNRIGTNLAATAAVPDAMGVTVSGTTNTIGGTAAGARNVISGNAGLGVSLSGDNNVVQANYIGTDAGGTVALGNQSAGVGVSGSGEIIGGATAAARNVISANVFGLAVTGANAVIQGNYIGTDATGTRALGNHSIGLLLYATAYTATIGGTTPGAGNVISGNQGDGIFTSAPNTPFQGNYIGTDASGTLALGNTGAGIDLSMGFGNTIGGTTAAARNVISANGRDGIEVFTPNNTIEGNYIGTDATGTRALGNTGAGVLINGNIVNEDLVAGNVIGGTGTGAGNVISANAGAGVSLRFANKDQVEGNYIGTDLTGTLALGNQTGVLVNGNTDTIGGTAAGAGNVISGNQTDGVEIDGPGNVVAGNRIGTDVTGTTAVGNHRDGVYLTGAGCTNNLIGGTTVSARNVISGNNSAGIQLIANASANQVQGNYIGTDVSGTRALGNAAVGVSISSNNNLIGGTVAGAGNVVSANGLGVSLASGSGNRIQGNRVGTNADGTAGLGNGQGLYVSQANGNLIGGTAAGAGNVISANRGNGVSFFMGANSNMIQGNYIGTDYAGTVALGNLTDGVQIGNGCDGNLVGGTAAGARNIISGNQNNGVELYLTGSSNQLQGNYIGTDATGTVALGNLWGVVVGGTAITIGGTALGAGNLISGNREYGIELSSVNFVNIFGNRIGTDASGTRAVPNGSEGIYFLGGTNTTIGGTGTGAGNLISGNGLDGIDIQGPGTTGILVQGNRIGTDADGTHPLPNGRNGVIVTNGAHLNTIGGALTGAGNLISGNATNGIAVSGGNDNTVQGNYVGTDVTGINPLGNQIGIAVNGASNTIGGTAAGAGNLISGNQAFGIYLGGSATTGNLVQGNDIGTDVTGTTAVGNLTGVYINATNNVIGGTTPAARNLISGNASEGLYVSNSSGTVIEGNYVGTDVTGTQAVANGYHGNGEGLIVGIGATNTIVGGAAPGAGNLLSGNHRYGLYLDLFSSGTTAQGNYIGTDFSGASALGNGMDGVFVAGSNNDLIGGTVPGAGNVISANNGDGIYSAGTNNLIQGNEIGTDVTGTQALGNALDGVALFGGTGNTIGGIAAGAGNLISANGGRGITINANATTVRGNLIGTDVSGTTALGNGADGIAILNASGNTVGGTPAGAGNLISGNGGSGVLLRGANATSSAIQGNYIGTDLSATIPLGNGVDGVTIDGAMSNTIGGTTSGAGNTIAFNGHDGVLVDTGTGNAIRRNVIMGHDAGLGIELVNNGNNNQASPVLTSAVSDSSSTTITGSLASTPSTTFTVEFFADTVASPSGYGEGERFLGSITVTTDATGHADFTFTVAIPVDPGQFIAATATDPGNNTSVFSLSLEVTPPAVPVLAGVGLPPSTSGASLGTRAAAPTPTAPGKPNRTDGPVAFAWIAQQSSPRTSSRHLAGPTDLGQETVDRFFQTFGENWPNG